MLSILILFAIIICVTSQFINKEVTQSYDISTSIAYLSTKIEAEVTEDASPKVYTIAFLNELADHLAHLEPKIDDQDVEYVQSDSDETFTYYDLKLNEIKDNKISVTFKAAFTNVLIPYPAEIRQLEKQYVTFSASHYLPSPYPTETQKSAFKLFNNNIESHTELSPYAVKGSTIFYGPYKNIEPNTVSPLTIHYYNHYPFARINSCHREIEVSHWGNVAFEEVIELEHAGAKLIGGFSRLDYQNHRRESASFRGLIANLPYEATNIYYRDQIGNISTSDLIYNHNKRTLDFGVQSRFPLFGGWKTQFYMGYSLPTELILTRNSDNLDELKLKVDFFTAFSSVWVEDMELKVILPEGSTDIKVNSPYPAEISHSVRFTYLDSSFNGGRPVIVLKAKNLVPSHNKQIEITYNFKSNRIFVEPFMIVGTIFSFFFFLSIISYIRKGNKNNNNKEKLN